MEEDSARILAGLLKVFRMVCTEYQSIGDSGQAA